MKILYISHYDSLYGANRSLFSLMQELSEKSNIDCGVVLQRRGEVSSYLDSNNIPYYVIPFKNEVGTSTNFFKGFLHAIFNIVMCLRYYRVFKQGGFDVIHTNSSVSFFGVYLSCLLRTKHVYHIREFLDKDYNLTYLLGKKFGNWMIDSSDLTISISDAIRIARKPDSEVIYNGVIYKKELEKRVENLPKTSFVISIIGHINPGKNQLEALKALNVLRRDYNVKLCIVGTGDVDYKNVLEKYIQDCKLSEYVIWAGYQREIKSYFERSDLIFMCSVNEGLGRVTIEGMAYGAIVLGFDNAGTSEVIKDGCNGFLYQSTEELIDKSRRCLEDIELRNRIRNYAMEDVGARFSIESYSTRILNLYNKLVYAS